MKKRTAFIGAILSLISSGQPLFLKTGVVLSTTGLMVLAPEKVHAESAYFYFMSTHKITDSNFDEEINNSQIPILVDFWAEWCGPCKILIPHLQEVAEKLHDKVKLVKIDIDANPQLATNYGIRTIPTIILLSKSKEWFK